jgi:hypothetical protein
VPRRLLSGLLVALAALALVLSLLTGYAKHNLFGSDQFANRAAASLKDDAVRSWSRKAAGPTAATARARCSGSTTGLTPALRRGPATPSR